MSKVTFNGNERLIYVINGVETLNVQVDLYSAWKQWVATGDNAKWAQAFSAIGGEPIPGGQVGSTFFLQNGWRVQPWSGNYMLTVQGNLYTDDAQNPIVPTAGVSVQLVVSSLPTVLIVPEGASSLTPEQIATAVLNSAQLNPIHSNVRRMNDAPLQGTGVDGDPWRG